MTKEIVAGTTTNMIEPGKHQQYKWKGAKNQNPVERGNQHHICRVHRRRIFDFNPRKR